VYTCHCFDDEALSLIQTEGHLLTVLAWLEELGTYGGCCRGNCERKRQKEGARKMRGDRKRLIKIK